MKYIKDGVVVFDGDRIEFVGKEYSQPVDKTIDAKGCLVSPGFIDTHFHSGINASDYILADSTKTDFFASNYLAHGGPTREGAHSAHLKDVDVGQRFSLIHVFKSGVTTTFDIGGAGGEPERYVDMIDQVGIRCVAGPSYKNVSFFHDREGRLEYDWDDERGSKGLKTAVDFAKKFNGACSGRMTAMLFPGHVDSCTPALLKDTRKAAKDTGVGIQIHATINLFEFHTVMQRERCTPIELLKKIGFLDPEVSLSHCIFISGHSWLAYPYGDDLKIIADSGASVAYSPLKYLKLGIRHGVLRQISPGRHQHGHRHRHFSQRHSLRHALRRASRRASPTRAFSPVTRAMSSMPSPSAAPRCSAATTWDGCKKAQRPISPSSICATSPSAPCATRSAR